MKLKKILSALTAAAMAVSVMAVTPVSVGAASVDKTYSGQLDEYGLINYDLDMDIGTLSENATITVNYDCTGATSAWPAILTQFNAGAETNYGYEVDRHSFPENTNDTGSYEMNVKSLLEKFKTEYPSISTSEIVQIRLAFWNGATAGDIIIKDQEITSTVLNGTPDEYGLLNFDLPTDIGSYPEDAKIKVYYDCTGATSAWPAILTQFNAGAETNYGYEVDRHSFPENTNDTGSYEMNVKSLLEKFKTEYPSIATSEIVQIRLAFWNGANATKLEILSPVVDVPAKSVTVAPETLKLTVGDTETLKATVTPEDTTDTVAWSSSNEAVATVGEDGTVKAVAAGTATITATAGEKTASCVVTVKPAKTVISPVLDCSADSITIYTEDTDAAKIAAAKSKVTLSGTGVNKLTANDYVIEATIKDNVVTLVFQLKNTDNFEIDSSFTGATATVTVTYSDWQPVVYNGYEIKGDLAIDVEADAEWTEVESIIGAMTIALTVSDEYAGYNDGEVTSELLKNCAVIEKATLTPGAVVTVNATINLGDVMNNGDKYIDASDITLGTSGAEKTELTVTFTVTVAEEEIVEDEEPDDGEEVLPDDDIINDGEGVLPDDDVIGDEEEVLPDDDDTTDGEDGVLPDDDVIEDEEPDDEEEVLPEEPKPSIPVITLPAKGADGPTSSVWAGEGQVNNAVGTGRATSSVMTAKSGATINVVVENSDYVISKKLLEKLANKKNVTVNFLYTGCTITINSDDINANIVTSIDPYKSVRFLTRAEAKMFADAKDYRQFRFTSADMKGIEKFTLTVKMKGSAKKADADLLKRNAANDFELIAESKVGADRTVSFEITESANYVVVAGEYTLD